MIFIFLFIHIEINNNSSVIWTPTKINTKKIRHTKFIKSHSLYVQLVDLVVTTFESSFWYSTFVAVAMMHQNLATHLDSLMNCSLLVKEDTNYHIACDMEKCLFQNHPRSFPSDIAVSCDKATSWALDCGTIMEGYLQLSYRSTVVDRNLSEIKLQNQFNK